MTPALQSGSITLEAALNATRSVLERNYHLAGVNLLDPPMIELPPLIQEIWSFGSPTSIQPLTKLVEAAIADPLSMPARDRAALIEQSRLIWGLHFAQFLDVSPLVFRAARIINLNHPIGALLFKAVAYLTPLFDYRRKLDVASGRLMDEVGPFLGHSLTKKPSAAALAEAAGGLGINVDTAATEGKLVMWYDDNPQYERDLRLSQAKSFGTTLGK